MSLLLLSSALALTLDDAWTAAEQGSAELRILEEQAAAARTLRGQAWSLVSPKVALGANYTINQRPIELSFDMSSMLTEESIAAMEQFGIEFAEPEPIVIQQKSYLDWNASVIQPLFNGQALPLLKAAYQQVAATEEQLRGQRAQVRAGIAQAYWGVVVAREGERVADKALANAKEHLRMAEVTTAVGTAAPTVKLQAELGVARAERELASAHAGVVGAEQAFARLTGLPATSELDMPAVRELPYATVEDAVTRAVAHRPEVVAADRMESAAAGQALARHLDWLPSVDGRFTQAYSENTGFTGENYTWMVVFEGKWTLWDGGYRIAKENEAVANRRAAALAAERSRAVAEEDVRRLWEEHARAVAAVAAVEKELVLAEENLRLADAAFAAGTLSYLEVEDARLGLMASRMTALSERMKRDTSAIALLAATGEL